MVFMRFEVVTIFCRMKGTKTTQGPRTQPYWPRSRIPHGLYKYLQRYDTSSGKHVMNLSQHKVTCIIDMLLTTPDTPVAAIWWIVIFMPFGSAKKFKQCGKLCHGDEDWKRQPTWTLWILCINVSRLSRSSNCNFCMITWSIWYSRNCLRLHQPTDTITQLLPRARELLSEFPEGQDRP